MAPHRPWSQWRLHVALLVGIAVCAAGFVVELNRGMDGHLPAWAYVVEWPLFAVVGTAMWWRLVHPRPQAPPPPAAGHSAEPGTTPTEDPDLLEWRRYVERLRRADEREGDSHSD
ncbi:MAG: hypothetical protein WAN48_07870 [Actinomycetes bacterium]